MNYSETPSWAYPASPQNQGHYGYEESRSPSNNSSGSSNNPYAQQCVSPDNAAYLSGNDNNGYASPGLSPGDWNVSSPNYTSPDQHGHYSYASPGSQNGPSGTTPYPTPSNANTEPFMYKDPSTASIPTLENNEKDSLDVRRQMAASAKATYLMQEVCMSQGGQAARSHTAANQYLDPYSDPFKRPGHRTHRIFGRERLATSTRKKKTVTPEEDFESITDYKCQLDIDRQKEAKSKALKLLSYF